MATATMSVATDALRVTDSEDELDFLSPKSRTGAPSGATTPTLVEPETPTNRMQLRKRQSKENVAISPLKMLGNSVKRKRTLQDYAFTCETKPETAKKVRVDDKKAVSTDRRYCDDLQCGSLVCMM